MTTPDTDPAIGLPLGPRVVDPSPAPRPQRTTLAGRYVTVTPLDPVAHADSLYAAPSGPANDNLWLYLCSTSALPLLWTLRQSRRI
jgi:hypothetical protein